MTICFHIPQLLEWTTVHHDTMSSVYVPGMNPQKITTMVKTVPI